MSIKKFFGKIHLWLGLLVGLVIVIICLCAALWAFSPEIEDLSSYRHVSAENKPPLPVSVLQSVADHQLQGKKAKRLSLYRDKRKAAVAEFYDKGYYYAAYINPYNGQVLKIRDEGHTFFRYVIIGHYSLWMGDFGRAIVRWTALAFLFLLVTGIVLWWPRNKAARKQRFKVKLHASPKRLNYDLHNVLGFYASWIILFAALTGVVWTFDWAEEAVYKVATGEKKVPDYPNPVVHPGNQPAVVKRLDSIVASKMQQECWYNIDVGFPENDSAVYNVSVYPKNRNYDAEYAYYNPYTGEQIPVSFYGAYDRANNGEKLLRMNYDIHVGNIFGFPGRIAMFFAALITASLPVTGFYIWWGKKHRRKR